jgi:hypothetical protein
LGKNLKKKKQYYAPKKKDFGLVNLFEFERRGALSTENSKLMNRKKKKKTRILPLNSLYLSKK